MKTLNQDKPLTPKQLLKLKHVEWLSNTQAIVKHGDDKFIIKRFGKCEPDKCKSICCKFIHITTQKNNEKYWYGFGKRDLTGIMIDMKCRNLKRNGDCKLWGKKLPEPCKFFPLYYDQTYLSIAKHCSFYYKIIHKISDPPKNINEIL